MDPISLLFKAVGLAWKGFLMTFPFLAFFYVGWMLGNGFPGGLFGVDHGIANKLAWFLSDAEWRALLLIATPTLIIFALQTLHFFMPGAPTDSVVGYSLLVQVVYFAWSALGGLAPLPGLVLIPPMTSGLGLPMTLLLLLIGVPFLIGKKEGPRWFSTRVLMTIDIVKYNVPFKLSKITTHGSARFADFVQSAFFYRRGDFVFGVAVRPWPCVQSPDRDILVSVIRPVVLLLYWVGWAIRILVFGVPHREFTGAGQNLGDPVKLTDPKARFSGAKIDQSPAQEVSQ